VLRERVEAAQAETQKALQALDQIRRADEARKARGRLRRAWDGWRGRWRYAAADGPEETATTNLFNLNPAADRLPLRAESAER
jgi:hypothetical protein